MPLFVKHNIPHPAGGQIQTADIINLAFYILIFDMFARKAFLIVFCTAIGYNPPAISLQVGPAFRHSSGPNCNWEDFYLPIGIRVPSSG